jgi:hypothetical protein
MAIRPRHVYETTDISIGPDGDRQAAIVLIDTSGPIDLSLHVSRDTLVRLRAQIDTALSSPTLHADR